VGEGRFVEVFVKASIDICEQRDPKGLYKKAKSGEIPQFTGISAPYEEPENAEIILDADTMTIEQEAEIVINYLKEKQII
jgi:adenylylsulfate kinase